MSGIRRQSFRKNFLSSLIRVWDVTRLSSIQVRLLSNKITHSYEKSKLFMRNFYRGDGSHSLRISCWVLGNPVARCEVRGAGKSGCELQGVGPGNPVARCDLTSSNSKPAPVSTLQHSTCTKPQPSGPDTHGQYRHPPGSVL